MVFETGHYMMQQLVESYELFDKVREVADDSYRDAAIEESALQAALAEKTALEMQEIVKNLNNISNDTTETNEDDISNDDPFTAHCIALYFIEEARKKMNTSYESVTDENTDSITCHTNLIEHQSHNLQYDYFYGCNQPNHLSRSRAEYKASPSFYRGASKNFNINTSSSITAQSDSIPSIITTIT